MVQMPHLYLFKLMMVKYAKENQLNMINGHNIMREIYKYDKLSWSSMWLVLIIL